MPAVLALDADPRSVALARRWTVAELAAAGCTGAVDTVVLLVSELVTNAVVHASTGCRVELEIGTVVRVGVVDASAELPELAVPADPLAPSGRGLQMVQGLSAACGAERLASGGKRVWFEVPVALAASEPSASAPPSAATA